MDILFLCQRLPYPPDKGEKIRAYHILRHLAAAHRVHLGTFVDDPLDWPHVPVLQELCASLHVAALRPWRAAAHLPRAFLTGAPLSVAYFRDRGLSAWVRTVLRDQKPEAVLVYSSAMAQYAASAPGGSAAPPRLVIDFVDVDSDKWAQYARTKAWPLSAVYDREARRLLAHDRDAAVRAQAATFVSEEEAALFRSLAPESAARSHAVPNGIDTGYFTPDGAYPAVAPPDAGPVLVFTGTMDYWPNVDAVRWFAAEAWPSIRDQFPSARFYIVGTRPAAEVAALGGGPGIVVTGRVEDVRPYLAAASIALAPMRIARGVQNKVLEAMAMAKPVVTTREGLEGIAAEPGAHLVLAERHEDFAAAVIGLLRSDARPALGLRARRLTVERYSWQPSLERLSALLEGEGAGTVSRDT